MLVLIGVILLLWFVVSRCARSLTRPATIYSHAEPFVPDYYAWDWNNPEIMSIINNIHAGQCDQRTYSMFCDLTDDSMGFCRDSHNIPQMGANQSF